VREDPKAWRVTGQGLEIRIQPGNMWGPANNAKNVLVRAVPDPAKEPVEVAVTVSNRPTEQYEQVDLVWYYDDSHMVKIGQEQVDRVLCLVMGREEKDRTRTFVADISPLGLVQMTRQNISDGPREVMTVTCEPCDGVGIVLSDETVARLAPKVPAPLVEIIRQNELRLLRHDDIVRGLCRNPNALASTIDGACDFCVRNGLVLLDVPQIVEAHRRIHGTDPSARPAEDSAAALMAEYQAELAHEAEEKSEKGSMPPPTAEQEAKRVNMAKRVLEMSVAEKIKLATLGNREARTLLLRDSNRLVSLAAAQSPRITDGEILGLANSKTSSAEVLRYIYERRDYLKLYALRTALVRNPKVPLPTALRFLPTLQEKDIKELARDRNVPATVQAQAKAWIMKREQVSKGPAGGKH
jgi:hypothetical protein